jgi:hypothetical protein
MSSISAEASRLAQDAYGLAAWKHWGPYVSLRQWGTVREDYSADGDAWRFVPHDQARSRAYRWGEDGLGAICDRWQHLCFGIALWNGNDPFLKERLFGLTNHEGNHGEDVKEYWWPLDSTPTHSFMRWLYRYPQARFPYEDLIEQNRRRRRLEPEYELVDTGVLDGNRFFDVEIVYAKSAPDDICICVRCTNVGPEPAELHVLPTVWFRNTWAWGRDPRRPALHAHDDLTVALSHGTLGRFWLSCDNFAATPTLLYTDNETNQQRIFGVANASHHVKDGINDHVVNGARTVNPARTGTKAAAWYRITLRPGATQSISLRLANEPPAGDMFGTAFERTLRNREREADEFFADALPAGRSLESAALFRRAIAGLLWTKQYYRFHVSEWLEGDPATPPPPEPHKVIRNADWAHLANSDIISVPDKWEYPWYASWDLAFHMLPMALVDPAFAKEQLVLLCREWYMHPNGQLPAYEWGFDNVNPPVHAWAAWRVYKIDAKATGVKDYEFLQRVFHKLLLNFTWWVNRKDAKGNNVFAGGFLGLDNIGLFDRSQPLSGGGWLEQADATSWMAMYALNMLAIALELAEHDRTYEDIATKFFEHFLGIAHALNSLGLWDDADGFFYDLLLAPGHEAVPLKVRSAVGLVPLFAVETIAISTLRRLPDFYARTRWFARHRPELWNSVFTVEEDGEGGTGRHMLSVLSQDRLRRVLTRLFDESEFLSAHGIRSMSRAHNGSPVSIDIDGTFHRVDYEPAESTTEMFGGNSNWRGPVWFPINFLIVESLQKYHWFLGNEWRVPFPTGSTRELDLASVAGELSRRLIGIFLPDSGGRRPVNGGNDRFDFDSAWRDKVGFPEYFNGDTGAGLGASQQTGWTALVAKLVSQSGA